MDNMIYLFAAYAVVWLALFGYLAYVNGQVRSLRDEVRELRQTAASGDEHHRH